MAKPRVWREGNLVFCMSFRHWRSGKTVTRPCGRPFCFHIRP